MKKLLTKEQSDKLIEKGLSPFRATYKSDECTSIYSLNDILECIPFEFHIRYDYYQLQIKVIDDDIWEACYLNRMSGKDELSSARRGESLIDALAELVS